MATPTPGRIVLFTNERYELLRPALVESVNTDGTINLVVFSGRHATGTSYEDNVGEEGQRRWQWPVRDDVPTVSKDEGQAIVDAAVAAVGAGEDHPVPAKVNPDASEEEAIDTQV